MDLFMVLVESWNFSVSLSFCYNWMDSQLLPQLPSTQHRKRRQLLLLVGTRVFCDTPHGSTLRTTKTPTKEILAAKLLQARLRMPRFFRLTMRLSHILLTKPQNNHGSAWILCEQCAHLPQHPHGRTCSRKEGALHNSLCPRALDSSVAHQMGIA